MNLCELIHEFLIFHEDLFNFGHSAPCFVKPYRCLAGPGDLYTDEHFKSLKNLVNLEIQFILQLRLLV